MRRPFIQPVAVEYTRQTARVDTILERHPLPPRPLSAVDLLRVSIPRPHAVAFALWELLFGGATAIAIVADGPVLFAGLAAAFALLGLLAVMADVAAFAVAMRTGMRSRGTVLQVGVEEDDPRELDIPGIPALPTARGTYRIEHPLGDFERQFELTTTWSSAIENGAQIAVLVHPRKPKVLLNLGIEDVPGATNEH